MTEDSEKVFSVDYIHLEPNRQIGLHSQPTWELSYIIFGSGNRVIGGEKSDFRSGEVVLIPPELEHCWKFNDTNLDKHGKISDISVTWSPNYMIVLAEALPLINLDIHLLSRLTGAIKFTGEDARNIRQLLMQMVKEPDYLKTASFIKLLLMIAHANNNIQVGNADERKNRQMDKRKSMEIFVSCNLARAITLDAAAKHIWMNRSSFCVFFKREFGLSFFTYLNVRRINMACYLLKSDPDKSISQVCFACGFTSISYFDRIFKKTIGKSPKEYLHSPF